jgi:hypothetical protein
VDLPELAAPAIFVPSGTLIGVTGGLLGRACRREAQAEESRRGADAVREERCQNERDPEPTVQFLGLVNRVVTVRELVRGATEFSQKEFWFGAVGVRLREAADYPYCEPRGFPARFVQAENYLCSRSARARCCVTRPARL